MTRHVRAISVGYPFTARCVLITAGASKTFCHAPQERMAIASQGCDLAATANQKDGTICEMARSAVLAVRRLNVCLVVSGVTQKTTRPAAAVTAVRGARA